MSISTFTQFIHTLVNANNQVTLIIVSLLILVYTAFISSLKKEWMRYVFLPVIGGVCLYISGQMSSHVNQDFFSGLSTELFGAALALALIDNLASPSMKWLLIFGPIVIGAELLMYHVPFGFNQNLVIGMVSNLWGAFLVAILIDELVYDRRSGRDLSLEKQGKRREFLQFERDSLLIQTEKVKLKEMIKELETEIQTLRGRLGIPKSQPWDSKIIALGQPRMEEYHRGMLAQLDQLRQNINDKKNQRNLLLIKYREKQSKFELWRFEKEVEHLQKALAAPPANDWDLHITFFGQNHDDIKMRMAHVRQLIYFVDRIEIAEHESEYCHCTLKATTRKPAESDINTWYMEVENAIRQETDR